MMPWGHLREQAPGFIAGSTLSPRRTPELLARHARRDLLFFEPSECLKASGHISELAQRSSSEAQET